MDIKATTKGTFTAISLAAMRNYLKFEDTNATEDTLITQLMNAAVEKVEDYCNIALRENAYTVLFEDFEIDEGTASLPVAPFKSFSSAYIVDKYGVETQDSNATYSGLNVVDVYSPSWIEGYRLKVDYVAGYTDLTIPQLALTAIYKTVSEWYENRGDHVLSGEVRRMLNPLSFTSWI